MSHTNLSPLLLAFFIAMIVRVAVGSATVAMTTAAGIIAPVVAVNPVNSALLVIAIACGATGYVHFNDSGFWLISKYSGTDEKDTLKTWSVMASIIGTVGIVIVMLLSLYIEN